MGSFVDFINADNRVINVIATGERTIARHGPGRRCPDNNTGISKRWMAWLANRKPRVDCCRGVVLIFDLGLGKRGLFNGRPHHRLGTAIEAAIHQDFAKLSSDCRLGVIGHGGIRMLPVAKDAKPLEFLRLDIEPIRREITTFLPKLGNRNISDPCPCPSCDIVPQSSIRLADHDSPTPAHNWHFYQAWTVTD